MNKSLILTLIFLILIVSCTKTENCEERIDRLFNDAAQHEIETIDRLMKDYDYNIYWECDGKPLQSTSSKYDMMQIMGNNCTITAVQS